MAKGDHGRMNINRRHAVAALIAAGLLWGTTVPLSKLALQWLSPGWLTVVRFGLAAAVLLVAARGRGLRRAFTPAVLAAGALGYGGSVLLQNAGISRTSVTHAALLIGAVPVLVAIIAAVWHRTVARPMAWFGFTVSLGGIGLITAGGGGGGATLAGDGLVLASLVLSATVTVAQGRLLHGRDPVAVTAVQFLGAALGALPVAALTESPPTVPHGAGPVLVVLALAAGGTLLPFTLFAFGQSKVSAEVAGGFLNLEPLVGAIAGAVAFGDPVGVPQAAGGVAIVAGIGLSSLPLIIRPRAVRMRSRLIEAPLGPSFRETENLLAARTGGRYRRLRDRCWALGQRARGGACRVRAGRDGTDAAVGRAGNCLAGRARGTQARRFAASGPVVRRGLRCADRSRLPGTASGAGADRGLGGAGMDGLPVGARRRGGLVGRFAALAGHGHGEPGAARRAGRRSRAGMAGHGGKPVDDRRRGGVGRARPGPVARPGRRPAWRAGAAAAGRAAAG
jgi:drug/metabolite transporter (DMT)-like permease